MTTQTTEMTMVGAINSALNSAMKSDENVILIGEDIGDPAGGVMKVTLGLSTEFGENRVWDTPISESGIIGAATGAAMVGMRPVAEVMINDFMTIAMDQLVNLAAKHHYVTGGASPVPLTVRTGIAAKLGSGATHSQSLEALLMHMPGLKVGIPSTPYDAKGMLTSFIFDDDPCVFFENFCSYQEKGEVPIGDYTIPIGEADIKKSGSDISLITYGWPVQTCLAAAKILESEGISAEVVDLRWLVPIDVDTVLNSVGKTKRAVIVHAATRFCGAGAEISAMINEDLFGELKAPVGRVAAPYVPAPAAALLESQYFLSVDDVVNAAKSAIG